MNLRDRLVCNINIYVTIATIVKQFQKLEQYTLFSNYLVKQH